jgi:hypothetical protein
MPVPIILAVLQYGLPTAVSAVGAVFSFFAHRRAKDALAKAQEVRATQVVAAQQTAEIHAVTVDGK